MFNGSGDDVVQLASPIDFGVMTFECSGCDGNVVVETRTDLLVNEIGSCTGKRVLGAQGETTDLLEVQADGARTMTVGALDDRIGPLRRSLRAERRTPPRSGPCGGRPPIR